MIESIKAVGIIVLAIIFVIVVTFGIGYFIGFIVQLLVGHQVVFYGLTLPQITGIIFVVFRSFAN